MSTVTWVFLALVLAEPATVRIKLARMPMMAIAINNSSSVKAAGARRARAGRGERPGAELCMGGRLLRVRAPGPLQSKVAGVLSAADSVRRPPTLETKGTGNAG